MPHQLEVVDDDQPEAIFQLVVKAAGLRADLDALHIHERTGVAHASRTHGKMHACGHDGHITMLLGAAGALARRRERLRGTVYFIFQPAEENEGGGRVMVEEGFFSRRYVVDAYTEGRVEDVMMLPISIIYDQLHEVSEYAVEATGGRKQKESLGWMIRAMPGCALRSCLALASV